MLVSLKYSFKNKKQTNLINLSQQTAENLKQNEVFQGP